MQVRDNVGMSPAATLDPVCAGAVELARREAVAEGGAAAVGEYESCQAEGDRLAVHYFRCSNRAYRGWRWAVSVARAARSNTPTVCEVVLLPGPEAMLAPEWIPWQQRLRPGDLGVGDLLPTAPDDARLVPSFAAPSDDEVDEVAYELGLGRHRVLSLYGRDLAAARWASGRAGPQAPIARAVSVTCGSCGFFVQLSGGLRRAFGVCANEYAPDDGLVIAADHGCGAHSEIFVDTIEPVPAWGEDSSVSDSDSPEPFGHS